MVCLSCKSLAGEQRISPGPTIYEGQFWVVEHAYPCDMKGWLVLVLKRHVEVLHQLTQEEFLELAELQAKTVKLLFAELNCEKEYSVQFAEAENFNHVHFHLVAKPANLPEEMKGPGIFKMLQGENPVPAEEIKAFCEDLRRKF